MLLCQRFLLLLLTIGFLVQDIRPIDEGSYNSSLSSSSDTITIPQQKINIAVLTDISSNLYSTTGYENLAAARLAIQDINANKSFLPDYYFDMKFKDDGCDRKIGLKALSNVYSKGERIHAVIGISCSVVCELAGYLCSVDQWNIPVVSHSCSSDDLSKSDVFPTFSRLSLSVYKYVDAIIRVCQNFKWEKVGIMVNNINWYVRTANKMKDTMEDNDIYPIKVFLEKYYYDEDATGEDGEESDTNRLLKEQLNRMRKDVRVIIIVGYAHDIIFVLKAANKLGMTNGHFAFLTQEFIQAEFNKKDIELMQSIQGVLDFEPLLNKLDRGYISFSERVREVVKRQGYPQTGKDVANLVAAQMYDAVFLYAKAVEEAVSQGMSIDDGGGLVKLMSEMEWTGKSGEIRIDDVGDRLGNVQIMNIQSGEFRQVGTWWMSKKNQLQLALDQYNETQIIWPGNPGSPPVACGRQYELCQTYSDTAARITMITLASWTFVAVFILKLIYYSKAASGNQEDSGGNGCLKSFMLDCGCARPRRTKRDMP